MGGWGVDGRAGDEVAVPKPKPSWTMTTPCYSLKDQNQTHHGLDYVPAAACSCPSLVMTASRYTLPLPAAAHPGL